MDFPSTYQAGSFLAALQTLGVPLLTSRPLSRRTVLRAYREQVKRHHPDRTRNRADERRATVVLQEINGARDYVMKHFDRFVGRPTKPAGAKGTTASAEYAKT